MKKVSLADPGFLQCRNGAAYAQSDNGVMMSTDPAKAADVEQRAQDLQNRPASNGKRADAGEACTSRRTSKKAAKAEVTQLRHHARPRR